MAKHSTFCPYESDYSWKLIKVKSDSNLPSDLLDRILNNNVLKSSSMKEHSTDNGYLLGIAF